MELDEHHMWKDRTWLVGSSPALPSNFEMSEGSLVNIEGQPASWCMGSFINWLKSDRLNPTIKGSKGAARMVLETVPLDVTTGIELEPTPGCLPAPAMAPNMVTICSEGGLESEEDSEGPGNESVWGLKGL